MGQLELDPLTQDGEPRLSEIGARVGAGQAHEPFCHPHICITKQEFQLQEKIVRNLTQPIGQNLFLIKVLQPVSAQQTVSPCCYCCNWLLTFGCAGRKAGCYGHRSVNMLMGCQRAKSSWLESRKSRLGLALSFFRSSFFLPELNKSSSKKSKLDSSFQLRPYIAKLARFFFLSWQLCWQQVPLCQLPLQFFFFKF